MSSSVGDEPIDDVAAAILEMGRLAASRLDARTLEAFRLDLEHRINERGEHSYFRQWRAIVDQGVPAVAQVLSADSERGRYLRSVISLSSLVSQAEREEIFRRKLRHDQNNAKSRA
jgi:hypothetical protein